MLVKPGIQTKTASALSDNVFDGVLDISDLRSASIQVSGTFSLTLLVEVSNDLGENPDTWDTIETITTPGMYPIALSYRSLRLRCSSYVSGSATVSAVFSKEQPITMSVDVPAPPAAEGGATEVNQTNGSQKTQIVDVGGEAVTVTGGKLDVNASIDTTGLATAANQQTDALTDTELRAMPVPVSAASLPLPSGAATAANQQNDALTDTELRATPLPVSGTFYPATQPVSATDLDVRNLVFATDKVDATGTVLGAGDNNIGNVDIVTLPAIPAGTNNIGDVDVLTLPSLPAGANNIGDVDILTLPTDARLATAVDATASGDTTIVSITNSPRLYYVSLSANGANSADVTVIVRIGASAKYKVSLKAGAIWARNIGAGRNYITGSTGDDIIVNLSAAQTVHVSVEYADI